MHVARLHPGYFVIARSASDEAIHAFSSLTMDCFACAAQ